MLPIPSDLVRRSARLSGLSIAVAAAVGATTLIGCADAGSSSGGDTPTIVVTYSVLGSLVRDAVGEQAEVIVLIPNGSDPHEWEPSAKDIERVNNADLIVRNGLELEGGIQDVLGNAHDDGVATFIASDHIDIRLVGEGEGLDHETHKGPKALVVDRVLAEQEGFEPSIR